MAIALNISDDYTPGQNHHYLNQWISPMLENIWHFNQCAGKGAPLGTANDKAGKVYLQSEREYIAQYLEDAASRMAQDLNYWPNPAFFSEEIDLGRGFPIQSQVFQARYCKMIALGKRGQTLIQSSVPVVYTDPNNTGVDTLATITLNTSIANSEVRLYFQVADGAESAGDTRFEIEPLRVTNNGAGVVTLQGHRALFVKPSEWIAEYEAFDPNFNSPNIVDTSDSSAFVSYVDVYRVYVDTSANIELRSTNGTLLQGFTGDIVNKQTSAFRMGNLCGTYCWDERPTRIVVNYYAGAGLVNGRIDTTLFEGIVALAAANMPSKLGKMSYWTQENWERWHDPMVESVGGNSVPIATEMQAKSKYGARTGAVRAWDIVGDRRIIKAHKFF